jgi:hypothetical protein
MEGAEPACVNATGIEDTTFFSRDACGFLESGARDLWVFSLDPSE